MRKALALGFALLLMLSLASCATAKDEEIEIENSALALTKAYAEAGRWEEALKVCDRALEKIQSPKILFNKILCLASLKRWDEAEELGIKAQEAYPSWLIFPQARMEFFKKQGKTDSAIQIAKEILEKDPYSQEVSSALLDLLISSGQTEEAQEFARQMLKKEVAENDARKFLFPNLEAENKEEKKPEAPASPTPEKPSQEPENDEETKNPLPEPENDRETKNPFIEPENNGESLNSLDEFHQQERGPTSPDNCDWIEPPFP